MEDKVCQVRSFQKFLTFLADGVLFHRKEESAGASVILILIITNKDDLDKEVKVGGVVRESDNVMLHFLVLRKTKVEYA